MTNKIFAGIKDAKATKRGNYLRPGHYWLLLIGCKIIPVRQKGDAWVNETVVLHIFEDGEGYDQQRCHRVGEEVTHMMMAMYDSFQGNVKGFLKGVSGADLDDEDIDEEMCEYVTGPDQPLVGMVVEVQARTIQTREGNPFTVVDYRRPVSAEELARDLPENVLKRYFPDDALERYQAREEAQQAG